MKLVILESPYKGKSSNALVALVQRWLNRRYARRCMRHSLILGEAPIASHLLYTQRGILNDQRPSERQMGIDAGLAWGAHAESTVMYVDRGITDGMRLGILAARAAGRPVIERRIRIWW